MKRTTLVLTVFTAAMVMALMMVAMALPVFAGGADDDEDNDNESANGGSTRNGQIVFRRWLDPDQTKGALFTMNPDGKPHPPDHPSPKGLARRLPGVVPRWDNGRLLSPENRRDDEPHHGLQHQNGRRARGYTLRT